MTDKSNQHLSALLDGEELDKSVLDKLLVDDAQKDTLNRYQLAGSIMRNEVQSGMKLDISAAVAAQVAAEPAHNVVPMPTQAAGRDDAKTAWTKPAANDPWWRPAVSFAVAASVALVAVIGVHNYQLDPTETGAQEAPAASPVFETSPLSGMASPVSFNAVQEAPMLQQNSQSTDQRRYIQSFFVDHQQQTQLSQQENGEEDKEQAPVVEQPQ